jgi:metal-sulfur cluster biosynthetic enzyme
MQAHDLDERDDLGRGATDEHPLARAPQPARHHREIDHHRRVGERQAGEVDEQVRLHDEGSGHRTPSATLGAAVLVATDAEDRGTVLEGDDGGESTPPGGQEQIKIAGRPKLLRMATMDDVEAALTNVIDPELGLDFVELGLIYEIAVDGADVHVVYTLTSQGCPIGPQVEEQIDEFVSELEGVQSVTVASTFTPPWTPDRMSEDAKFALGY